MQSLRPLRKYSGHASAALYSLTNATEWAGIHASRLDDAAYFLTIWIALQEIASYVSIKCMPYTSRGEASRKGRRSVKV